MERMRTVKLTTIQFLSTTKEVDSLELKCTDMDRGRAKTNHMANKLKN